jgi:hypothetical protein
LNFKTKIHCGVSQNKIDASFNSLQQIGIALNVTVIIKIFIDHHIGVIKLNFFTVIQNKLY